MTKICLDIENFLKFDSSEACKSKKAALGKCNLLKKRLRNQIHTNEKMLSHNIMGKDQLPPVPQLRSH